MRIAIVVLCLIIAIADVLRAQPPRLNRTIELLSQGRATFGVLSHDRSLENARAIARSGLDYVVTPLVRIAPNRRDQATFIAKQVLDVGAMGIMFPYVNTATEAESAIRSMRYPQLRGSPDMSPAGIRGAAPVNATWFWGVPDYQARADVWPLDPQGELMAVIQIETEEALTNVDAIVAVSGVSAIFIGPADLSLSLGYQVPQGRVQFRDGRLW